MRELLITLNQLKTQKKELGKELRIALLENPEFASFDDEAKAASEVLRSFKNKLIQETPALGALAMKIGNKKMEIKVCKQSIRDSIMVVSKADGSQLELDLKF